MTPGMAIKFKNAPTELGKISIEAQMEDNGMNLSIQYEAYPDSNGMVLHLPPFVNVISVTADGKPIQIQDGAWPLPVQTQRVHISWKGQPWPQISFEDVVKAYIKDYRNRASNIR